MAKTYTIVKKDSKEHQSALASQFIKNREIVAVGDTHVFIPRKASVGFGHRVSHAKNRTNRLFRPNLQVIRVEINGENKAIRISGRDNRTYQKVMASAVSA